MAASTAKFRFVGIEHAAFLKKVTGAPDTIVEYDIHFINSVAFDPQTNEIDFEGDNQTVRRIYLTGINITLRADTYDLAAISNAFGKNEVTTIVGVAGGTYFGDTDEETGVTVGFVAQVRAENLTTGLNETVRITFFRARAQVVPPPALGFGAKGGLEVNVAAEKTAVDLLGVALPGVPTGGAVWRLDRLTS